MSDGTKPDSPVEDAKVAAQAAMDSAKAAASQVSEQAATVVEGAKAAAAEVTGQATAAAAQAGSTAKEGIDAVVDEATRLVTKGVESAKTLWESDQRKGVEEKVRAGLGQITETIEEQVKKLSANEQTKQFVAKAEETAEDFIETVKSNKVFQDVAAGFMKGVASVTGELEKLMKPSSADKDAEGAAPAADEEVTEIKIEKK